jgi:hypothetical protein
MNNLPSQVILIVESAVNREYRKLGVMIEERRPFHFFIPTLQVILLPNGRTCAAA